MCGSLPMIERTKGKKKAAKQGNFDFFDSGSNESGQSIEEKDALVIRFLLGPHFSGTPQLTELYRHVFIVAHRFMFMLWVHM